MSSKHPYNTRSKKSNGETPPSDLEDKDKRKRKNKLTIQDIEFDEDTETDDEDYIPEDEDAVKDLIKSALTIAVDKVFDYSKSSRKSEMIDEESIDDEEDEMEYYDESQYFKKLPKERKDQLAKLQKEIDNLNKSNIPIEYRILESNIPLSVKAYAINKLEMMGPEGSGEMMKFMTWVDNALRLPLQKYNHLPVSKESDKKEIKDYIWNVAETLERCVHGHKEAKQMILQIVAQWISNPNSYGQIIGLQGPPGTGKTTLVKDGVSVALQKPFTMMALGGATDSSFLEGHSYTYEGSSYGKIVSMLMETGCMNPVIYMDELDKISGTKHGEEIVNVLIHLTDTSQNNEYHDRYFMNIPLDLSKALFIFSFNDLELINPILRDRMLIIKTDAHTNQDKSIICKKYLLPKILFNNGFSKDEITIEDEAIEYIIENFSKNETGVRELKRSLEQIMMKLNAIRLTYSPNHIASSPSTLLDIPQSFIDKFNIPYIITLDVVKTLLKTRNNNDNNRPPFGMYM